MVFGNESFQTKYEASISLFFSYILYLIKNLPLSFKKKRKKFDLTLLNKIYILKKQNVHLSLKTKYTSSVLKNLHLTLKIYI